MINGVVTKLPFEPVDIFLLGPPLLKFGGNFCPRSEETLKMYFSQFGALECAEVMKDRYTGKSRGFGFVTFLDPCSATRALAVEHTIDGRRCEAKVALPKVRGKRGAMVALDVPSACYFRARGRRLAT